MSGSHSRSLSRTSLEVPRKSIELVDPGAHELSSEGEEDHFSDASEGQKRSRPVTPVSPIPRTRIEKVDDEPSYGEVPGTPAYDKRALDAVPDEVEILSPNRSRGVSIERPTTPGGTLIPRTVVEKLDPESPSYGEVPGTPAYQQRQMDAAPDVILKTPDPTKRRPIEDDTQRERPPSNVAVPETIVFRVDSEPAHGEVPGTEAYKKRALDAAPDIVEKKSDESGNSSSRRRSTLQNNSNESNDFGDDFDDFEEGGQAGADDDFGDFDDEFQEPEVEAEDATASPVSTSQSNQIPPQPFPLIDFSKLSSVPELFAVTQAHLDAMFPSSTTEKLSFITQQEPVPDDSPIFPSDRSRSLWKQLITPPPLQSPNWTQSRIRRLFLISLGVPVDLDEILPPSKQKKLILPDINLEPSSRQSESDRTLGSVARLKARAANDSTGSVDSTQSGSAKERRSRRPKGPPPPPELDLMAVKRLCATTDEKLDGLTDEEMKDHVKELQDVTERTLELLEYWLKRRDGLRKEKEAFEEVIENLVRHARRVRK
ncbi:hypothetical protein PV08_10467 [Exophiala spinifera]|uniref:Uncharacterized protein n=1 Tax=Exophiala spinifera TaxID=91928 RepID=A0A0D1ZDU2_9EURO|nr:uncharacterized protein PV08_10467 [Exophiala spinifera]KIW11167.1 hypothetical protein PV08_10467 [Exophiala spinifera]